MRNIKISKESYRKVRENILEFFIPIIRDYGCTSNGDLDIDVMYELMTTIKPISNINDADRFMYFCGHSFYAIREKVIVKDLLKYYGEPLQEAYYKWLVQNNKCEMAFELLSEFPSIVETAILYRYNKSKITYRIYKQYRHKLSLSTIAEVAFSASNNKMLKKIINDNPNPEILSLVNEVCVKRYGNASSKNYYKYFMDRVIRVCSPRIIKKIKATVHISNICEIPSININKIRKLIDYVEVDTDTIQEIMLTHEYRIDHMVSNVLKVIQYGLSKDKADKLIEAVNEKLSHLLCVDDHVKKDTLDKLSSYQLTQTLKEIQGGMANEKV